MTRRLPPGLPPAAPGMAIGLYGGSFNPPHAAHRMVALAALRRLRLDRIWLLVTPGNPLKDNSALPPLADRMAWARRVVAHPRIEATSLEAELGVTRSRDLLAALARRRPDLRFVFVMGADNLVWLHEWGRWREIAELAPIAVIDRPGATFAPLSARAAQALARFRIDERDAPALASMRPPAWVFLHGPRSALSSTALRGAEAAERSFRRGFGLDG